MKHEELTRQIIGCAYKVYKKLARPPRLKAKPMAGKRKVMKEKINPACPVKSESYLTGV